MWRLKSASFCIPFSAWFQAFQYIPHPNKAMFCDSLCPLWCTNRPDWYLSSRLFPYIRALQWLLLLRCCGNRWYTALVSYQRSPVNIPHHMESQSPSTRGRCVSGVSRQSGWEVGQCCHKQQYVMFLLSMSFRRLQPRVMEAKLILQTINCVYTR